MANQGIERTAQGKLKRKTWAAAHAQSVRRDDWQRNWGCIALAQPERARAIAVWSGVFVALIGAVATVLGVIAIAPGTDLSIAGGIGPGISLLMRLAGFAAAALGLAMLIAGSALAVFGFRPPVSDDDSGSPRRTSAST
jgi:hypothetical protein